MRINILVFRDCTRTDCEDRRLYADGLESHLDGGADSDLLELADGAFIENAGTDDFVMLGGIRLSGGVQQWWMENGYAYFASATSVD